MDSIEVRPHRGGWKVFEAPGVEPYFTEGDAKRSAIDYAKTRMVSRSGEILVKDIAGLTEEVLRIG